MFFLIFLAVVVAIATLDWQQYRRGRCSKRMWWLLLVIDALPIINAAIGLLFDNTPTVMRIFMWITWSWMVLTLPRLTYYLLRAIHLRRVGIVACFLVALALIWGAVVGRKALYINEVEICSKRLPEAFDGMRIAHFSDLHLGALVDTRGEVGALVRMINEAKPDLVCFTGDLVNIRHTELDSVAMQLLREIEAPLYSVLGNHDVGTYIRDSVALPAAVSLKGLIERQEAMGWQLLQDTTIYLRRGADSITLTGLSFDPALRKERHDAVLPLMGGEAAYRAVPTEPYNITLVHVPQLWQQIIERGYGDLTLAGHTHAMQMKIRCGEGRGWSPAAWLYKEWSGRYEQQGRTLYINDGIGYVGYPLRLGAAPEVTLITLKRCK